MLRAQAYINPKDEVGRVSVTRDGVLLLDVDVHEAQRIVKNRIVDENVRTVVERVTSGIAIL